MFLLIKDTYILFQMTLKSKPMTDSGPLFKKNYLLLLEEKVFCVLYCIERWYVLSSSCLLSKRNIYLGLLANTYLGYLCWWNFILQLLPISFDNSCQCYSWKMTILSKNHYYVSLLSLSCIIFSQGMYHYWFSSFPSPIFGLLFSTGFSFLNSYRKKVL